MNSRLREYLPDLPDFDLPDFPGFEDKCDCCVGKHCLDSGDVGLGICVYYDNNIIGCREN